MSKIKLDEILAPYINAEIAITPTDIKGAPLITNGKRELLTVQECKAALLDFGKQLLERAADNAKTKIAPEMLDGDDVEVVDKDSITNTIKEVEI